MLLSIGSARNEIIDRRLACSLAGIAGALNAAAFYAAGFFSANMTGNLSILSDHIALGNGQEATFYLSVILAFISGACAATFLLNAGMRRQYPGRYALAILVEGCLLLCLGGVINFSAQPQRITFFVFGIAFLMGLQNAVSTHISDARVRTTHISGIATDIGIAMATLIDSMMHKGTVGEISLIKTKLWLHAITIFSFFIGGILGVLLFQWLDTSVLWIAGATLVMIALPSLTKTRNKL
ncbi:MAG: YoaK family protein [bacterium]|nr:YoaK family protein [bacterium]